MDFSSKKREDLLDKLIIKVIKEQDDREYLKRK